MDKSYVVHRDQVEISTLSDGEIGRDVLVLQSRENLSSGITIVHPHSRTRGHAHPRREEHYYVLTGAGYIQLGADRYPIRVGDDIHVPPVSVHTVVNPNDEPLEFYWAAFSDEPKIEPDQLEKE